MRRWNRTMEAPWTLMGDEFPRPHRTDLDPPKGSVLEGKWDPEHFREI